MSTDRIQAVYVISVAAELAGMHPQTLRIYERRGLLTPARRLRSEVEQLRQGLMHAIREIENRGGALVPLRQTVARFGERPSIFDPNR